MRWMEGYNTKWKQHNEAMRFNDSKNKKIKNKM